MLACRVCLAIGKDDPEAWLDTATPRQLALWRAFYQLEPWGADFQRSATTGTLLSGLVAMVAAGHGQEVAIQGVEDFMPSDWADAPKKKKRKRSSPKQHETMLAGAFPTAKQRRF